MRKTIALIAAAAAMTFATVANAAVIVRTYVLDTTEVPQFTGSNFGTVTVTDNGVDLFVQVALDSSLEFRHAPDSNHDALTFDLTKNGQANGIADTGHTLLNLSPTLFKQLVGTSFVNRPFTGFDYAVDCTASTRSTPGCTPGWNPAHNPNTMSFKIAGVSVNEIAGTPYTPKTGPSKNIFFAVDVVNKFGYTGSIGAGSWSQISYAPEPGTWGLMILGFGCVGADLRRRRRAALSA